MSEKPKRLEPTKNTLRELFLKSGNQCAFPDCKAVIMEDGGVFVGQLCHIEAALPGGERFNPDQTNEQRRHFDNLMLMCYKHHKITNNVEEFPIDRLKNIKANHETKHLETHLSKQKNSSLDAIVSQIDKDSNYEKKLTEYLWSPKARSDFFDEVEKLKNFLIERIEEINGSYQNISLEHQSIRNNGCKVIYQGNELAFIFQAADLRVTSKSVIIFKIFKNKHDDYYSEEHPRPELLEKNQFKFSKDKRNNITWESDSNKMMASEKLVDDMLEHFIKIFS